MFNNVQQELHSPLLHTEICRFPTSVYKTRNANQFWDSFHTKGYNVDHFGYNMIEEKWTSILLIGCGIILLIGGIFKCIEGFSSSTWTLLHGILLIIFAIGLFMLGIRPLRKSNH